MARRPRQPVRDRRLRRRWTIDRRRQRLLITVGVIIVLAVLAIPAYGYYRSYIAPPRVMAARVGNTTITMGDLVKTMRARHALGVYRDPQSAAGAPLDVLQSMVENELVYQAALREGVKVSDAEVDLYIEEIFYPKPEEGEAVDPVDLEREFKESYRSFLTKAGLSDREYRRMVRQAIAGSKMADRIAQKIPSVANHVEVYWILVPFGEGYGEAVQAMQAGKDFNQACIEYNAEAKFADQNCYVGWVPEGAFPDLDEVLFSIEHDKVSDPIRTREGVYYVKVVGGPEARELTEEMREQVEFQAYRSWVEGLQKEYLTDGLLRYNFDSRKYDWVWREVRSFLPTPTPTPTIGG